MTINLSWKTGTETVSTTEWSLTTDSAGPDVDTTSGVYRAWIDLSALAAGDEFRFSLYEKIFDASATQRLIYQATYAGLQSAPGGTNGSFDLGIGWDMTIIKVGGTDRSISWRISRIT